MSEHRTSIAPAKGRVVLCIASYFKGNELLEQAKREGCHVILVVLESLLQKPWARQYCDEVFAVHSLSDWREVKNAVSYLARTRDIARIIPLDDFDVETAAHLREHLRIPGMGETTARYFRDKLAMRARARDRGIDIPEFVHVLNHAKIHHFLSNVPAPWLLKPRSEASAIGIQKFDKADDVWKAIDELGDAQSTYLIERMIPGDVFHVDSIVSDRKVLLAEVHQYRKPLFELMHQGGGIFATRTVRRGSDLEKKMLDAHARVIEHLGLVRGVAHTEFILGRDDDKPYFLETASRPGGAHITDLIEASTGINLWREWAKIEITQGEEPYEMPAPRKDYAGVVLSLARQEVPDTSAYDDPEIVWRLSGHPAHHVGLIVRADNYDRVEELLASYEPRIARDFMATLPAPTEATS
jgi:phosphoribosylaminoimidazole carboxylase (NCAIR synthetase)